MLVISNKVKSYGLVYGKNPADNPELPIFPQKSFLQSIALPRMPPPGFEPGPKAACTPLAYGLWPDAGAFRKLSSYPS